MIVNSNKLVRDKIPEIIKADGRQATFRTLDDAEYLEELIKKLGEEYDEFKADLSLEELADIQEVLLALAKAMGSSKEELEKVRLEKLVKRGGFEQKIFLEKAEVSDG